MKLLIVRNIENKGFTLLEVILTVAILSVMMLATSVLMRSSFDMKVALSQRANQAGKLNSVLATVSKDLSHAFMVSVNKDKERVNDGQIRTQFKVSSFGGNSKFSLTTMNNTAAKKNTQEGELSYVVYELKDSEDYPGRKDLYRGATGVVPEDFRDEPKLQILMRGLKSIKLEMWNGDSWISDWDTERSDYKQTIPKMVRVNLTGYSAYPTEGEEDPVIGTDEFDTARITAVYLPYSKKSKELKSKTGSMNF